MFRSARTVMVRASQPFFVIPAFVLLGLLLSRQWDTPRTYDWQHPSELAGGPRVCCRWAGWLVETSGCGSAFSICSAAGWSYHGAARSASRSQERHRSLHSRQHLAASLSSLAARP